MKNIIIAQEQGKVVAVGDNNFATIKKAGVGNFQASLEVLKEILSATPIEPGETIHIYLPDMLQGIVTGSAVEYVKTGKTGSGKEISAEDIASFKEFYSLYASRILNVRFSTAKYIKKENTALIALKNKAWTEVKGMNSVAGTVVTTIVDPNADLKAMLDAQIVEALKAGNMELVTSLTNYKNGLPAPTVVTSNAPGTNMAGATVQMPKFGEDADAVFNNVNSIPTSEEDDNTPPVDEEGNPIIFEESGEGKQADW